jgi:GDPmannose 4,6-dehydratase
MSAANLGIELTFSGEGIDEVASISAINNDDCPGVKVADIIMKIDPRYFRPSEVAILLGDPSKAKERLGWTPKITVEEMCAEMCTEMVASDLETSKQHALLKSHSFSVNLTTEG